MRLVLVDFYSCHQVLFYQNGKWIEIFRAIASDSQKTPRVSNVP